MPLTRLTRVRAAIAVALAALVAVAVAPAASAHTELTESTPSDGQTVALLDEVSLTFSSPLLDIGSELSIVDAEGAVHALEPTFPDTTTISAPVDANLPAGDAQLVWRIVAEDGHPIEGVIDFTYAPEGADATATATPEASPSASETDATSASPSASVSPTDEQPAPSPTSEPTTDDEGGVPAWIWWVVGAAVIGTGVTALVAVSRR
ncbi:MAG: copper resistance protein CopC [Demequina sp.]|uniref:copper resistance CopC family protein n=1 Tax=Demequina sp. TaxID=2050685 RepID=UPI003A8698DE